MVLVMPLKRTEIEQLAVKSFRLRNFKAVRDSGAVEFTPLTIFIGNNGSGKSSLIEGLETYRTIVVDGLDTAMNRWRGFEHIRNNAVAHNKRIITMPTIGRVAETNPVAFVLEGTAASGAFRATMDVTRSPGGNDLFILEEALNSKGKRLLERSSEGEIRFGHGKIGDIDIFAAPGYNIPAGLSVIWGFRENPEVVEILRTIVNWQFVMLNPSTMGSPKVQKRTGGPIRLENDGSNIAEYLLDIRTQDQAVFEGIIETLQYVLPYARDLQPTLTSELERTVYLQLTESDFKVPGWLLSSGTLRILCLLAVLRHPKPPPLIVIEEIENGLDPRTINLIVEEIRSVVESGTSQIIATTHSPYFLDLLSLSHIVLVERDETGAPVFTRPADQGSLEEWAKTFSPGRLYTMSKLGSHA